MSITNQNGQRFSLLFYAQWLNKKYRKNDPNTSRLTYYGWSCANEPHHQSGRYGANPASTGSCRPSAAGHQKCGAPEYARSSYGNASFTCYTPGISRLWVFHGSA